jgi:hypothetical protein
MRRLLKQQGFMIWWLYLIPLGWKACRWWPVLSGSMVCTLIRCVLMRVLTPRAMCLSHCSVLLLSVLATAVG